MSMPCSQEGNIRELQVQMREARRSDDDFREAIRENNDAIKENTQAITSLQLTMAERSGERRAVGNLAGAISGTAGGGVVAAALYLFKHLL